MEEEKFEKNDAQEMIERVDSSPKIDNNPDKKIDISEIKSKIAKNPWITSTIIVSIIALILLVLMFTDNRITGNVISADVAGERLIEFANSQGADAELVEVNEVGDFYEVIVTIQGQDMPLYVTKDGEFFTQSLVPLTGDVVQQQAQQQQAQQAPADVPKSDKPAVELYVFAYCPYGIQSEKGIISAVELLGDKIDFKIRQIGAMHGEHEKVEAERQLCVEKEYPTKFLDYVLDFALDSEIGKCSSNMVCSEPLVDALFTKLGIDKTKINSCMESDGETLYAVEEANAQSQGIGGSPTLTINGAKAQSGRDSASYLVTICNAFNEAPSECNEVLSSASPSPGFGGSTSSGSASTASC